MSRIPKYARMERSSPNLDAVDKALKSFEESFSVLRITKIGKGLMRSCLWNERRRTLVCFGEVDTFDIRQEFGQGSYVHEKLRFEVIKVSSKASQSRTIYEALESLKDEDRDRIVELRLQDMRLSGVGLPSEERDEFNCNKTQ